MSYIPEITSEAEADIEAIYDYIANELENPQAALKQCEALYDAIDSRDDRPNRFALWRGEPWKSRGVHSMAVKNYNVFYMVNEVLMRVIVLRVFYCHRDV